MNGSSSDIGTPANARRTGKPSPSNPLGAVMMRLTLRKAAPAGAILGRRGRTRTSSTVTAGMVTPLAGAGGPQPLGAALECLGQHGDRGVVEVVDERAPHRTQVVRGGVAQGRETGGGQDRLAAPPVLRTR